MEDRRSVGGRERVGDLIEQAVVGVAEQRHGSLVSQPGLVGPGQQLVEHRQRVPRRARAGPDHYRHDRGLVGHALARENLLKQPAQDSGRHQPERVMMRARPDGRDDLLRLGRGEDELQVRRRFLDQLEQRVEALPGHHVRLVDDVDLEAAGDRGVEGPFAQLPGVVDTAVRRRVDLDHVDAARAGGSQGDAGSADPAGIRGRALLTVQRAGEDPGAGRLTAAAWSAEQVGMVHPAAAERLAQRLGDVVLAPDLREGRRPIPPVQRDRRTRCTAFCCFRGGWTWNVACHDLILTGRKGTPRTPARARVPLLPSGPGGVGGINAVRGVCRQFSQPPDRRCHDPPLRPPSRRPAGPSFS